MKRLRDIGEIAFVLCLWAAAIAFIRPVGEFPLLDDWDFTIATWNFARTGHFHFTLFTAVSLRAMVLYFAAWARIFGESFLVLRIATMTLGAATIVIINRMLRLAGLGRVPRVIATLAFAFHPIFLWASCTHMTEVPFVCAGVGTMLLIWRGVERERWLMIVAGCALAIVSCFIRQTGVLNLIAPAIVVVMSRERRRFAAPLGASIALIGIVFLVRGEWLSGSPSEFASQYKMWHETSFRLPQQIGLLYHYSVFNAQNIGLFFLPLIAAAAFAARKRLFAIAAIVILLRVQHLINIGIAMPYFAFAPGEDILQGNILTNFGLGPPTLDDVWSMRHPYPFHLTWMGQLLLTYLSVIAGAILIAALVRPKELLSRLAVTLAAIGTIALAASGFHWDRYSLDSAWSAGIALALVVPWQKRAAKTASMIVLIIVGGWSMFSVQEYFAWQRARWQAFHSLRVAGVLIRDIDAGSEPSNFYEIAYMSRDEARRAVMHHPPREYMLAIAPLPGYSVVARQPFAGWFGLHRGAIYTLRRGS
ncbi:MAG TPA: glycosyltransferase family 39 protein [Thermoanaerobaculia bacterium]|nr:glycosyltransferase family 39 protein [Thermoanaerobaculia bacterium]